MDNKSLGLDSLFRADEQEQVSRSRGKASTSVSDIDGILAQEGADHLKPVIQAIYGQESGGGANSRTSVDGARGGMQVIPATFQRFAKPGERIDNPDDNMRVGVRIIKSLADKFGNDPAKIATGYFSGEGNVNPGQGSAWKRDARDGNGKSVSGYVSDVVRRVGGQQAAQPELPDLSKAPTWAQVTQDPEYATLSPEDKKQAKAAYFDYWIAPHAGDETEAIRAQFFGQQDEPAQRERTWGEAIKDTGAQLAEGVNTLAGALPNLVAPESRAAQMFNENAEFWRSKQSEPLRAKMASADQAITKAGEDGFISQVVESASQYFSDPALAARFVTTNLPSMIPGVAAAKVAQAAMLARGASAAKAASAATTAAGGVNAALNAGGARGDAFDDLKRTLIAQGYSEQDAERMAIEGSRMPAAVGGVAGFVSGKLGLEKALVGGAGGGVRKGVGSALGELAGEQIEEVSPQVATNIQAGQYDNRPVLKDVGRTVVETAIGSGPGAIVAGGATAFSVTPDGRLEPDQDETPQTVRDADAIVRELAAQAGIPESTVLPTQAPAESAAQGAAPDQDILDFASVRAEQLRAKRDGSLETVIGPDGPVDQEVPGVGLTPAEAQELAALEQAQDNPSVLRQLYGFDQEQPQPAGQELPAPENQDVQDQTQAIGPGPTAADQSVQPGAEARGPVDQPGTGDQAAAADAIEQAGQPVGPAPDAQPAEQAPAAENVLAGDERRARPEAEAGVRQEAPVNVPIEERSDEELRDRLDYIASQAKRNGGWDSMLRAAKREVEGEIARRQEAKQPQPAPEQPTNPQPQQPEQQTNVTQAVEAQQAEAQGSEQQQAAAPTVAPEAKPKYASKEDVERLFGIDNKRQAALDRIAKGTAYFATPDKAKDFIKKNGLADTHQVVQNGKRFEIVAKGAEPVGEKPRTEKEAREQREAPGTRINGDVERKAADRLEQLYNQMGNITNRNSQEGNAKAAVRSVIEELRKPKTVVSVAAILDGAASSLDRNYGAFADVIREVSDSLGGDTAKATKVEATTNQAPKSDDFDAMFDDVLAEEVAKDEAAKPKTEKEARAEKSAPKKGAPTKRVYNPDGSYYTESVQQPKTEKEARAQRTATESLASAAKNTAAGFDAAIDGLGKLFGAPGRLSSGLTFDEETYAKAKPLFQQAIANLKDAGSDLREAMRTVIRTVLDRFGPQAAGAMKPYVVRFIEETAGQAQNTQQEARNDTDRDQSQGARDQGQGGNLQPGSAQADSQGVADSASEDVGQPKGKRDGRGSGPGAASGDVGRGGSVREGGDAANRRPRTGREGMADDGAGERAGANRPESVAPTPESQRANYFISDPEALVGGTPKVRFARNKKAIEAFQSITSEGRDPTQDELDAMAGYIGWGSFGQELFQGTYDRPRPKDGWQAESDWLREHLGKDGWNSAQASIINAHYTDPITVGAMWDMVRQLGFTGGRVLEPSMGVGNFFGLMPRDLMAKSRLAGIEMEQTTGGMAQVLYPDANIQIKPYQDSKTADNFYDLVIGNWPFAKDGPADRRYMRLSPSLHDYFFLKALDQTRPGGLVVGITSAGTMDKKGTLTRAAMAEKADLVAAYRLPSGAFEKYAGTAVVTDIIILKKRETPNPDARTSGWLQTAEVDTPSGETITVNEYFAKNPDKVLGRLNFGSGTTYGRPAMIVERPADLEQRLRAIPGTLPANTYQPVTTKSKTVQYVTNNTKDRQQAITVQSGKLFQVQGEYLAPLSDVTSYKLKDAKKTAEREAQLAALVKMRQSYGALIDAERDGADDAEAKRKALREQYQAFTKEYGRISESDGLAILKRVGDPFYPSLASLEMPDGSPSAILSRPTVRTKKKLEKPSVRDALVIARNENIDLDMARVATLAGVSEQDAAKDLIESGAVFQTPDGSYEVKDVYLSGNVRRKLREAEAAAQEGMDMERNIKALKEVMPADIPYFNIEAKLGATWVRPETYVEFVANLLGVSPSKDVQVKWAVNRWKVRFEDRNLNGRPEATTTWGHPGVRFDRLLTAAMGNVAVKITYKDEDGNLKTDEKASAEANEKAGKIRDEFANWLWSDPVRKIEMERNYNEVMNAIALPKFDGSFLSFDGMALQRGDSPFNLRKHQIDAIWRGLANGRSINAHEVGTGKTYTMGGLAVESRRYGLAKKPIIFAHNANSASVAREIGEMYPGAKLLYIDNLAPDRIAVTLRQIANDEWDAVVVPHSLIDRFTLKRETLIEISREQIEALEQEAIEAAQEDNIKLDVSDMDDEKKMKSVRSATAKQLVHARNAIIKKVDEMALKSSREDAISFEDMGIDMVIVDEAHEFKKPPIATRMRMRGLNTQTSSQSISLMFMTDYVKRLNAGRGVHVFTGTPITNTMTEIFNMMRYVMDDQMARDGLRDWDAWFNTFADSTSDVELTASGEYEPVTRLASFVNVAELRRMVGQYMDIVFADDMPEFKPRETSTGKTLNSKDLSESERDQLLNGRTESPIGRPYKKVVADVAEMTPDQASILAELQQRANTFKNASKKARRDMMLAGSPNSPVIVETDAANAGLDARLFDMSAADTPANKVNRAAARIVTHYKEHPLATQVVFVERGFTSESVSRKKDSATGKVLTTKKERFNLVQDLIEKLVAAGVPKNEIAVVDGGVSKEKRKLIADAMNRAEIRVVIGNTKTLGVGVNMQANLRAMHHLDAPWMPGDLEQRNGRGHRQGNKWNTVMEYRYLTERIDGRRWQVLAVKDRFIKAFLKAKDDVRVIEGDAVSMDEEGDIGSTLSEAAGDPRLLMSNKLKADVERLENKERMHSYGVFDATNKAKQLESDIERKATQRTKLSEDDAAFRERVKAGVSVKINGRTFDDAETANVALARAVTEITEPRTQPYPLGEAWGFKLYASWPSRHTDVRYYLSAGDVDYSMGKATVESARQTLYGIKDRIAKVDAEIASAKESIPRLQEAAKAPFARAADLEKKRKMLADLEADIQANPVPAPAWLRNGAPVNTEVFVDGKPVVVEGHRWTKDGYLVTVSEEGKTARDVDYQKVTDENGLPVYEVRPFAAPEIAEPVKGEKDPAPRQFNDISVSPSFAFVVTPEPVRNNALTKIKSLQAKREDGKITEAEYRLGVQQVIGNLDQRTDTPTKGRGADWIVAQLRLGVAQGTVPRGEANFAEWLLKQNPNIANDLGMALNGGDGKGTTGNYNPLERIATLFTSSPLGSGTAVHEILHHMERMMPRDVQDGVMKAWQRAWDAAYKAGDDKLKAALSDMLAASLGDKEAHNRVKAAFANGSLQYAEHYQLFSPSEFWAVNATDILIGRYAAKGSWVARAAQWFKEFVQRAKAMFGLRSDAPVLKALEAVMRGEGAFQPGAEMMAERVSGASTSDGIVYNDIVRNVQNNVIQFFGNRKDNIKTFGVYDKTLATQYHKALKDRDFGRVFNLSLDMQNAVSQVAIRPAELAPAILPRVDDVKSALKTVWKGKKASADLDAAAKAIFAGTLAGNNVMEGKVFTDDELRSQFKMTDAGIALYKQARAAIDSSLDELAASEAYAMAHGFIPKSLRARIVGNPQNARGVITGALSSQMRMLQAAIRTAQARGNEQQQSQLEASLQAYLATQQTVDKIFDTSEGLKAAGYAPLMRFGKYTVTVYAIDPTTGEVLRDANGDAITEFYGQYETKGEARAVRNQKEADYQGRDDIRVTTGVKSQTAHELYAGISPETLAVFADAIGAGEAMRQYYQLALTERSALKRRLERKGIAGFSEDMPRVLSNFITSNARFAAQRYYQRDLNNAIKFIPKEKGDVLDEAIALKKFINNPNDPAAPVSAAMFAWFLGGSVASAAVNLTQPVLMTAPYLAQHGVGRATTAMAKAMPYALGKKQITDGDLRDALKQASQEGIVDAQEIFHLYSVGAQGVASGLTNALAKLPGVGGKIKAGSESARARINAFLTLWGSMFSLAEGFNRKLTFIAAWEVAKAKGEKDAYAFAVKAVNETQGIYNKVNRPNWARGPVGRTVLTFKQFSIAYVELLSRMWKRGGPEGKRAALMMLAMLMLASGEEGLPFSQDLDDLIDTVGQFFGFDTNMRRSKRRLAHEILGKTAGDLFLYGISSQLPLDFAGRLGLGNIIPGSGALKRSDQELIGRNVAEILGPAAGMATQIADAYDAYVEGNQKKALQNLAPKAVKDVMAGLEMADKGYATDAKGRKTTDVTQGEAAIKAAGFTPTTVAQLTRATMPIQQDVALQRRAETSILDEWVRGIADNDQAMIDKAMKRMDAWNKDNPDSPIVITAQQIQARRRAMSMDKETRLLKAAPREMRGRVAEGLDAIE